MYINLFAHDSCLSLDCIKNTIFGIKNKFFFSLEQYLKYLKVNVAVSYYIKEKKSREYEEYILFVSLFCTLQMDIIV